MATQFATGLGCEPDRAFCDADEMSETSLPLSA